MFITTQRHVQLGLLRNYKQHINISVPTDYHQAMYKILRKKIRTQRTHMFYNALLLAPLLNQVFFLRLAIPMVQSIKSFSM